MWWTHTTNWSRSPFSPTVGSNATRTGTPAGRTIPSVAIPGHDQRSVAAAWLDCSDAAGGPVPLGGASHPAELGQCSPVGPDGIGHLLVPVEQSLELALVQGDAHDLPLELVGYVGVLSDDAHAVGQLGARVAVAEVLQALEVGPPGVREVLVEGHDPCVVGAGHHPAPALLEQAHADVATQLMIDVAANPEREVDLLRL